MSSIPFAYADYWTPTISTSLGGGFRQNETDDDPRYIQTIAITYSINQSSSLISEYLLSPKQQLHTSWFQEYTLGFRSAFDLFQVIPWTSISVSGRWQDRQLTPTVGVSLGADYKISEHSFISLTGRYTLPLALIGILQLGYTFGLSDGFDPL